MTNIRGTASIRGTVLDLPHALSLSGTDCNVLLVSSRTLFFIQQFGLGEMTFRSRYASEFLDGARYVIAETATELDDINDIVNLYGLEVVDVGCDIVAAIQGVQSAILTATSNACACGTVGETIEAAAGTPGGAPPPGFGEPDPAIVDRLCQAANAIHESIVDTIVELNNNNVDGFLSLGFGVVSGLISAIVAAAFIPVVGVLVVGVAGAIVGVTLAVLAAGLNLQDLEDDLASEQQDLICALVEAVSATAARSDYIAVLAAAGSSTVNNALIAALLTNDVLDLLYFSTGGSEAFLDTYVAPISCASCAATFTHVFDFTIDDGGWTNGAAYARPFGVYVAGVGWASEWGSISGLFDERLYLQHTLPSRSLTSIEVFYIASGPTGSTAEGIINPVPAVHRLGPPLPCDDCDFEQLFQPGTPVVTTDLRTSIVGDAPAEFGTDFTVYKISVSGLGSDPF